MPPSYNVDIDFIFDSSYELGGKSFFNDFAALWLILLPLIGIARFETVELWAAAANRPARLHSSSVMIAEYLRILSLRLRNSLFDTSDDGVFLKTDQVHIQCLLDAGKRLLNRRNIIYFLISAVFIEFSIYSHTLCPMFPNLICIYMYVRREISVFQTVKIRKLVLAHKKIYKYSRTSYWW